MSVCLLQWEQLVLMAEKAECALAASLCAKGARGCVSLVCQFVGKQNGAGRNVGVA